MTINDLNSAHFHQVAVIGGGPAGLMAAEILSQSDIKVTVFDAMPSVGRKFLMAGKGGMNITHSEPFADFIANYGTRENDLHRMLERFGPNHLRRWLDELGIVTFTGSSGRVFPTDMKAAPLLRLWLHRLRQSGVKFQMRHVWQGFNPEQPLALNFQVNGQLSIVSVSAVILALGGGSWAKLGSTGAWVEPLQQMGIDVAPLKPSNCGFEVCWSAFFREQFSSKPVKSVSLSFTNVSGQPIIKQGEFVITDYGIEGSLIYAFSASLREALEVNVPLTIYLDLLPDRSHAWLVKKLSEPRGKLSMANFLRKKINLDGVKLALLREFTTPQCFNEHHELCKNIKALPIKLTASRPLDEAISSAGGIAFPELSEQLMLKKIPGVFCAGEMLDWEAPTGGYLLTACFATGVQAGMGALEWLQQNN